MTNCEVDKCNFELRLPKKVASFGSAKSPTSAKRMEAPLRKFEAKLGQSLPNIKKVLIPTVTRFK